MKYLLRVFLLSLSAICISNLNAQDSMSSPFKWKAESKKTGERKYELSFSTEGVKGWQLYSPVQTLADLNKTTELLFRDSAVHPGTFLEASTSKSINSAVFENKVNIFDGPATIKVVIEFDSIVPAKLQGILNYTYGNDTAFNAAIAFPFNVDLEGGIAAATKIKVASIDINNPVNNCGDEGTKNKSILTIFLLGFLGGFIALLTPCVFPLIPVTVTFFTKKSPNKKKGMTNAILYGLFIFLIYVAITIPFHLTGAAKSEVFNNISTNVWLNILFFVIFVIFAFSFFGFYEIGLPSSLANKADSKSGAGNLLGIFFMAATLTIVSFSCTGPILGTLLAGVADGGAWPLTAGAAGFGLALGLPFALFAMFPNWLQSLPKSGGWMTTVKVVLGFVELALAVKFLANADNVEQWGIIKREVFVALWILIGAAIVLYLSGVIRFSHDAPVKKFSKTRIAFITLFAAFTVYLVPGLFNSAWANLKLLSGFPPPLSYSIYPNHVLHAKGVKPLVNDYDAALKKAKAENKPVLIDFTGWACVNCRRMEEKVWTNNEVDSLMRKEFVISLYVDERTKLPLKDQITYTTSGGNEESIVTIGDKWTAFQKENFKAVSQPQYIIISPDEKALTKSKFYTPKASEFADWLKCGLDAYRKK
jgi:cytochrome c biogenesis protein CcdA/thioredoxin-related protein